MSIPDGLTVPYLISFVFCFAVSLLIERRTRSVALSLIPIVLVLMVSSWLKDLSWLPTQVIFPVMAVCIARIIWLVFSRLNTWLNEDIGNRGIMATERELEILRLVAQGLSNKTIGAELGISE